MAIAKWFPELTRATPLRVAARTVLEARAVGVEHYLKQVKHGPGGDPEDIHQLRVATRRLAAALSIFKSCLDRRAHRRLRRATRKLRRAAGAVRDWDVQQSLLNERFSDAERVPVGVVECFRRELQTQRRSLQKDLKQAIRRWAGGFRQSVAATFASLDSEGVETNARAAKLVTTARATLRTRLKQLLAAGRRDLHDLDNLHQLRIAAKRLRYAMEVFAVCYPRDFQHERYTAVERLQEDLGNINDLRNLAATLTQMGGTLQRHQPHGVDGGAGPLLALSRDVDRDLHVLKSRFLRRWTLGKQAKFYDRFESLLQRAPAHVATTRNRR